VTPKCLGPIISKTAGDTDSVTIEHLYEMAYGVSNGHTTDDLGEECSCDLVMFGRKIGSLEKSHGIGQWTDSACSYEHYLVLH